MKWMTFVLVVALAAFAVGCTSSTTVNTEDGKLTITAPADVTLTEGAATETKVKISMANEMDEDVTVTLEGLPEGVKVAEKEKKIAKKSKDVEFVLTTETGAKFKEVTNAEVKAVAKYKDKEAKATFKVTTKKAGG